MSRTGHCPPTTRVAADRTRLRGHLTLEFSNASAADYAVSYRTRAGKYQSQYVTLPKV